MLARPTICGWLIGNNRQIYQQSGFGTPLHCALLGCAAIKNYLTHDDSRHTYQDMMESTIEIIIGAGADVHCLYSVCCPSYFASLHSCIQQVLDAMDSFTQKGSNSGQEDDKSAQKMETRIPK